MSALRGSLRETKVILSSQGHDSDEMPTDKWFPANMPERHHDSDVVARVIATVAVLLVAAFYLLTYSQKVDEVNRDRAACARQADDMRVELRAWRSLSESYGLDHLNRQVKRIESILRRDCDKRYPEPSVL